LRPDQPKRLKGWKMQITFSSTDTTEALEIIRVTIDAILGRRTKAAESPAVIPESLRATPVAPTQPAPTPAPQAEKPARKKAEPKPKPPITVEEVRQLLIAATKAGKESGARTALTSMGFAKLSEVPADRLEELAAAVRAL
jgi:hypothetical protein